MNNKKKLNKIYSDIANVKIQGATNIAKAAVEAYMLEHTAENKKRLLSLRATEPTLSNALNFIDKIGTNKVILHFSESQKKINSFVLKIIKNNMIIYTHCHSTNVVNALIYAHKKGKKFEIYNTETRPLFQGRKTAKELSENGIRATNFADSALHEAIKKCNLILLGADAILKSGVINKIGSDAAAEIAFDHKKPVYIISDSWKFSPKNVKIEERDFHEVWKNAPAKIKIRNPAFEKINPKYIKGIVSEYGILKFDDFIKKVDKMI